MNKAINKFNYPEINTAKEIGSLLCEIILCVENGMLALPTKLSTQFNNKKALKIAQEKQLIDEEIKMQKQLKIK